MSKNFGMKWYGNIAKEVVREAAKYSLERSATDLQKKSSDQAPVDIGDLRANCNVGPIKETGTGISITVGYSLPYAIRQHEELDYRHPKGGKAKYLEDPYNENINSYRNDLAQSIRTATR